MTNTRVSGRRELVTGDSGNGMSDAPMDVAIVMAMVMLATPIAAERAGPSIVKLIERNANGKLRRRSKFLETAVALSDWWSRMEWTMRQQAQGLMQLHQTIGKLTNLLKLQAAREEAQWRGMMTWMQERDQ
jgi:hypothetical protein